jgi:hypothetical protein
MQTPLAHAPEQHWPLVVQVLFIVSQATCWHTPPVQVVVLPVAMQQSLSCVHMAPADAHTIAHVGAGAPMKAGPVHVRAPQHGLDAEHELPAPTHMGGEAQIELTQLRPVQHVALAVHASPTATQLGPARHVLAPPSRLGKQAIEQQSVSVVHVAPVAAQLPLPHTPPVQA